MVVLMGFNAFGTRLQSFWIKFFCQKRFSLWSEKPNAGQNPFETVTIFTFFVTRYFAMSPQVFSEDF